MTTPHDDWPRLMSLDIDPAAIAAAGEPLPALIERLGGLNHGMPVPDAVPDGWRVLAEPSERYTILGAPADPQGTNWHIAQLASDGGRRELQFHPEPLPQRPSRAKAREGLELRWPALLTADTSPDDLVVDIANTGTTRWVPGDEGLLVLGVFTRPEQQQHTFGWTGSQQTRGVPLDPGEYVRVRVSVSGTTDWNAMEPGRYELHAHVADLGLRTRHPFAVDVTAEQLAGLRAARRPAGRSPDDRRRSLERHRAGIEAQLAVFAEPARLIEIVRHAASDAAAVGAIAAEYDYDRDVAETVYRSMLSDLAPASSERRRHELASVLRSLERVTE